VTLKAYVIVELPTSVLVGRGADGSLGRQLPGHYNTISKARQARERPIRQNDAEDHAIRAREQGVTYSVTDVSNFE
jgi:hypothetical protein